MKKVFFRQVYFCFLLSVIGLGIIEEDKVFGQVDPIPLCETELNLPDCSMICNPDFESLSCEQLIYTGQANGIAFYRMIFENLPENENKCEVVPGWESIYGTPDYSNADDANNIYDSPSDARQIAIWAWGASIPNLNCLVNNCGEGLITEVDIQPDRNYILTYLRQVPDFFKEKPGETKSVKDPLSFLRVNLTNLSEITWTSNSYDLTNQPSNFRNIIEEINLKDTDWEKSVACFSTTTNEVWDALYVYAQQEQGNEQVFAYLDQIELIEDTFPDYQDYTISTNCGEPIYIGDFSNSLCVGISDMQYIWEESVDGVNWTRMTGLDNQQFIQVNPNQNTFYRLGRKFETTGNYNIIGDFTCIESDYWVITVNVIDFPEDNGIQCCLGSVGFDYTSLIANPGPETWNDGSNAFNLTSPVRIDGDFVVPTGADLRIDGMTFEFGMNGRVVVEQGAELMLNNCVFTGDSECQTMWQGIQVIGPGMNNSQNIITSGSLIIDNTRIEHALIGAAGREIPLLDLENLNIASWADLVSSDILFDSENHFILTELF